MKTLFCFAFFLATLLSASALTVQEAVSLYNAIMSLDQGYPKTVEGKTQFVPYSFAPGVRAALADDAWLLQPVVDAYKVEDANERARAGVAADEKDPKKLAAYATASATYMHSEVTLRSPLKKVTKAEIDLSLNPMPIAVYAGLRPAIEQSP
jgi:hypothetical protein